ncbi:PadR family transcriptional regulator [Coriobacteriia bacterium Es71-Z0120]|uniref:PadR family transcriptional regulator n=1 Tax=Parvivirga hydrogeniphila TaxID=2939460 RepID=UPI002260ABA2|nr:PadR family transcriptional regulator [Parvivirga hydrogeniphila]MCL4079416.1 PadR family transcriptional regulator [Parvivirga hydrogeniphila]
MPNGFPLGRRCCEAADGTQRQVGRGRWALVEPLVLAGLASSSRHGYELAQVIEEMTGGTLAVDLGGLYRTLRRLEAEGLVTSEWEDTEAGPQRRRYTITADGVAVLQHWRGHLAASRDLFARAVDAIDAALPQDEQ